MDEIRMLVMDEDADFKERFVKYVVNVCKNISIHVDYDNKLRSKNEIKFKKKLGKIDVVLISEEKLQNFLSIYDSEDIPIICLRSIEIDEGVNGKHIVGNVYKYQDASVILSNIISICGVNGLFIKRYSNLKDLSVITVTGASGGVGKTSLCLTFARLRKQLNKRNPLIVDLRSMSDHLYYFPTPKAMCKEDINLFLVDQTKNIENPEKYFCRDRYGIAEFIAPREHRSDIIELNREEMEKFIQIIQEWDIFDVIIFEMGTYLNDTAAYLYEISDCIFSLSNPDTNSKKISANWELLIRKYSGNDKIIKIINNADKKKENIDIFPDFSENIENKDDYFKLPYDPDSFFTNKGYIDVSLMGKYGAAVDALIKKVVKQ